MRKNFEARYKSIEYEHRLLIQLTQIKKEPSVPMRDFIERFNKLSNRIPATRRPTIDNQKIIFISSIPPDISFQIRQVHVPNLKATQALVIELEDDLIAAGKWK